MSASVSLREYFAAAGSRFTAEDAAIIGPQFEALAEQNAFSEDSVLEVARSSNSPLHRYLTWDDKQAAHERRIDQVRAMMRAIKVRVVVNDRPRVVPAYRVTHAEPKAAFRTGHNVLRGESAAAVQKAREAFDALTGWRARYAPYVAVWADFAQAFRGVANQIAESEDAVEARRLEDATDEAMTDLGTCRTALVAWQAKHAAAASTWPALAEQAAFLMEAIDEAEAVFTREQKAGERACLRCGATFQSGGVENRMCRKCSATTSNVSSREL